MSIIRTYKDFLNEKSISELDPREEKPMVQGISYILRQIKDVDNRKEIAKDQIRKFKEENIVFDYDEFLKLCNL
jgi:hypothetical protein